MTIINGPAGALEALYQGGGMRGEEQKPPVLLLPPHPRLLGNAESAVLSELVWQLGLAGHPTLRFNHRGVGASAGLSSLPYLFDLPESFPADGWKELIDDATAAKQHLELTTGQPARLIGYSVGGAVAAALAHTTGRAALLISPAWHRLPPRSMPADVNVFVAPDDREVIKSCRAFGIAPHIVVGATTNYGRGLPQLGHMVVAACGTEGLV
jgi:uncharacterized protein